jgi:hypothetical protein
MSSCEINDDAEKLHMCSIFAVDLRSQIGTTAPFCLPIGEHCTAINLRDAKRTHARSSDRGYVHVLPWLAHRSGSTDALPPERGRTVPTSEQFLLGTTLAMTIDKRRGSSERRYDIA